MEPSVVGEARTTDSDTLYVVHSFTQKLLLIKLGNK